MRVRVVSASSRIESSKRNTFLFFHKKNYKRLLNQLSFVYCVNDTLTECQ